MAADTALDLFQQGISEKIAIVIEFSATFITGFVRKFTLKPP